ncbi:MAG: hypothetical protein ACI9VT_002963 [Psychroserpens sp.]
MIRIIFILSIPLLFTTTVSAQDISVVISLPDREPATGAVIQLMMPSQDQMIDFAIYDSSKILFEGLSLGNYSVKIKLFGYQEISYTVSLDSKGQINHKSVVLSQIAYDLPGISVVDKIIGLKKRGDTIAYNIRAYRTNTERTLGDVLSGLPGIDIDDNGNVSVLNKKVDDLLIDGRELVNSQHKVATEGITSDKIESIELVRNHRTKSQLFSGDIESEQVAVNVILTKEAQGHWNGNVASSLGRSWNSRTAINLLRSDKQAGWSLFLRHNTVGDRGIEEPLSITLADAVKQNDYSISALNYRPVVETTFNQQANLGLGTFSNNDYHFVFNGDSENRKGLRNNIYATGTYGSRMSRISTTRLYLEDNLEEVFDENRQDRYPFLYFRDRLSFQTKKTFFEFLLPIQSLTNKVQVNQLGAFAFRPFGQGYTLRRSHHKLSPQLSLRQKISKGLLMKLVVKAEYESVGSSINLKSDTTLLGLVAELNQDDYYLSQNSQYAAKNIQVTGEITKRWGRNLISYGFDANNLNEHLSITTDTIYDNDIKETYFSVLQHGIRVKKRLLKGKIQFTAAGNQTLISSLKPFYLPNAVIAYNYYKGHSTSVSYRKNILLSGAYFRSNYSNIINPREINTPSIQATNPEITERFTFSLFKKPEMGGMIYNFSYSFGKKRNDVITLVDTRSDFVLKHIITVPQTQFQSLNGFLLKSTGRWSSTLVINYRHDQGFMGSDEFNLKKVNRSNLLVNANLKSIGWKNLSISVGASSVLYWQNLNGDNIRFVNQSIKANAVRSINDWKVSLTANQSIRYGSFIKGINNVFMLDTRIEKDWQKFTLYLYGTNLLNLVPVIQQEVKISSNFSELQTFETFSGQIAFGIMYRL